MVLLRYQMSLLQIEVTALLQDPSLSSDTSPFYQTLTTIGVLVNNLTSRAVIATSTVSSLDSLWSSLQNNINILNNHLTGSTTTALRLSLNKTDEIILRYNQTVASYSVVENLVRISFSLLNGTVSTRISQQASAITQLQALQSEIERYLTTAQTALAQATSIRNNTITNIASSVNIASTSANLSLRHRTDVTNLNVLLIPLRSSIIQTRDQALRVQTFAQQMHRNASQALAFANYTRGNVTVVLTDYSQVSIGLHNFNSNVRYFGTFAFTVVCS